MKNIIELLGIVLPALIILLGIVRVFMKKTAGINGLTMLFAILLLIIGFIQYFIYKDNNAHDNGPKPPPLTVGRHSESFNRAAENMLNAYTKLTDGFAATDTTAIANAALSLKQSLDSFPIAELQADTLIYETALQPYANTKAELASIIADPSFDEKKASFNVLSNELYTLLRTVRYDMAKLYWKECPSAFGEDKPGNWLSRDEQGKNPYVKDNCAETRSTINFVADSTQNKGPVKEK